MDDDYYDIAVRYGAEFDRLSVSGALSTAYIDTTAASERVTIGSMSVLDRQTGLNLSLAAGHEHLTGASYGYLKAGWRTQLIAAGTTKFMVEGFGGADCVTAGSSSTMWSVSVIQEIDDLSTELYICYRAFSYADLTPVSYQDASALQIGARFRF